MAIIETNWNVERKDLRLFGTIGAIVFGTIALLGILKIGFLGNYVGRLLSWQMMSIIAVLCSLGTTLKSVPADKKQFGVGGAVFFAALAVCFYTGHVPFGQWFLPLVAAFFAAGAFVLPEMIRPVYLTALVATFPIGMVMGPVVMGVMFYGVFTPVALFFRLVGRDALTRRIEPNAPTYWVEHDPATSVKRYFRQF